MALKNFSPGEIEHAKKTNPRMLMLVILVSLVGLLFNVAQQSNLRGGTRFSNLRARLGAWTNMTYMKQRLASRYYTKSSPSSSSSQSTLPAKLGAAAGARDGNIGLPVNQTRVFAADNAHLEANVSEDTALQAVGNTLSDVGGGSDEGGGDHEARQKSVETYSGVYHDVQVGIHAAALPTENMSTNSTCDSTEPGPLHGGQLKDHTWPLYKISDHSEGFRPDFPWGKGVSLDDFLKSDFRFYLYEDGVFNMSAAEDCFRRKWTLPPRGSKRPFEGLDWKMSHENRMYLLEIFLFQAIRDHPLRTMDPEKANLFFIGYAPILLDWSPPCDDVPSSGDRTVKIMKALESSVYWQRNGGKDHLFLWTRYNIKPDRAFRYFLDDKAIVCVLERSFFMLIRKWPKAFAEGRVIMLPYVSSGFIDTLEDTTEKDRQYPKSNFFFRGNMQRKGDGLARSKMLPSLEKMLTNADFKHKRVNTGKDKGTIYTDLLNVTSSQLRNGGVCPCPEGDSPTTLRPFEALAAGCVPFFMVNKSIIAYDIPFPSLIDWDSIAFFAKSMGEIGDCPQGLQKTYEVLEAIGGPRASPEMVERLKVMRQKGKEVFRRHFSFIENPIGVVSSMLFEGHQLNKRGFGHNVYRLQGNVNNQTLQEEPE